MNTFYKGQKVIHFNQDPDSDVKVGTIGTVVNTFYYRELAVTSLHIKIRKDKIVVSTDSHWRPVTESCSLFE